MGVVDTFGQGMSTKATSIRMYIPLFLGSLSGGSCVYKYKLYETLDAVKKIRQIVQPNPAFMAQLVKWEDSLRTNAGKVFLYKSHGELYIQQCNTTDTFPPA